MNAIVHLKNPKLERHSNSTFTTQHKYKGVIARSITTYFFSRKSGVVANCNFQNMEK